MFLKYFYDPALAHASYLVGCQRAKQALIVDPGRDIDAYLVAAAREGMAIVAVAETHIHADYVSGARELADRVGAKLYVSDEGPAEWKYQYLADYDHQLCKQDDRFSLGKIEFEVMHTPGHTPESISFVLTDRGGGADRPMGIFTGDFVFVGSIGRPDLLEQAAGMVGTAEVGARQLFHSVEKFRALPDYLQVWPAHGAGSACGKGLGAIPSSTVGYEKRFNPALQFHDEQAFVRYILSEQPEAPKYFAVMKRVNR
jgi:hydroxyacylglutathione hydrolase